MIWKNEKTSKGRELEKETNVKTENNKFIEK